jgi:hypothetical protein
MGCVGLFLVALSGVACSAHPRPMRLAAPDFQLTGYWLRDGLMDGSAILLSNPLDNRYPVRFSYAGCVASDVKTLTAAFDGGYLVLSQSVQEYTGPEFSRLALYQLGEDSYLVPLTDVSKFEDPKETDWQWYAFKRLSTIP